MTPSPIIPIANKLKVFEGQSLANFPAIQYYPETEDSRIVAAGIRATINVLWGTEKALTDWADYFWNRGLELETCNFQEIYDRFE